MLRRRNSRILSSNFELFEFVRCLFQFSPEKYNFSRYGMHAVVVRVFGIRSERYAWFDRARDYSLGI